MYFTKVPFVVVLIGLVNAIIAEDLLNADFDEDLYTYYQENLRTRRSPQGTFGLGANKSDGVTSLRGDVSGTLLKTDHTTLDGNAHYQRNWGPAPKYQTGAGLNFNHDSGITGSLNYDKLPQSSTLGATGSYRFFKSQDGKSTLDANAYYNRNFGSGPKYETGASLNLNHGSGFTGSLNYDKMPQTSRLGATAGYKIFESKNGRSTLDANAFYNRNFGGFVPKQNYGGFLNYRYNF